MCRIDGVGRMLFVCVVTLFVCHACLLRLEERENSSRDSPGRFRAQDFDPLGLKPEDPEALKEMQTKESRAASRITTHVVCVCRVDGVDHTLFCLLWLFVCRVSRRWRGHVLFVCCRCVSRSCRGSMRELVPRLTRAVSRRLQHGRLAMLAAAGMIVQELQTGATLF